MASLAELGDQWDNILKMIKNGRNIRLDWMIQFLPWAIVLISCVPRHCQVLEFVNLCSWISLIMLSYVALDKSSSKSLC